MKKEKWEFLLLRFIRQQAGVIAAFGLFVAIDGSILFLYNVEREAVCYALGLCAFVGLIVLGIEYVRFCAAHRERQQRLCNIGIAYEELPAARTLAEEDYRQMIRALGEIYQAEKTDYNRQRQDSLDYYSTWVHQIKTPIAAMRMTLQSDDTQENRELLAELFRIEQYVEMVLSYIRLDSDQTDFVFQEYDLDGIIRQAVRKYAPLFVKTRIHLVYEPVQVSVLTDEKWLLFIIEQLLSNAVKYTQSGGTVTIAVSEDQVLTVSDTGMGIAPEDLPRIFDKGFTGYHGRADKKATGLGLYLCRRTADKLGITIRASSAVGEGSSFSLDLRREPVAMD